MIFIKNYIAELTIVFVWLLFCLPLFRGLVPYPSLFQSNFFAPWSAYETYQGPVKNNAMPDIITQIYPWRTLTIDSLKNFELPLWNPYSFAGTPHLANYQSAPFFPLNILFFLPIDFIHAWTILVLLQPLLAGLFMIFLLKSFRLSSVSCIIGAISFMFCGFITTWMGYSTLGYAILFLPLALFSVNKFIDTSKNKYGLLLSISVLFSFLAGHFQTSTYLLIAVFSYILFIGFTNKSKKQTFYLLIYMFCGLLLSMPQVLPALEFYFNAVRQSITIQLEVIPLQYLVTLFAPDVFGNPVTRNDWFGHYAEWNGFSGTPVLLLAVFSIIKLIRKNKYVIFFLLLSLFSILLAFDTFLNQIVFDLKLPLFSTSASSRVIVLLSFSFAILSAFGLENLYKEKQRFLEKKSIISFISWIIIVVLSWLLIIATLSDNAEKFIIARNNLALPTLISGLFIASLFFSFFTKKTKIKFLLIFLIAGLVFVDMYRFTTKWMPFDPGELAFKDVGVASFYKDRNTNGRYLADFSAENSVYYRIQSLGGYDPLYPSRYGEFVKFIELGKKESGDRSVVNFPLNSPRTEKAMDFLGVEYIPQKKSDTNQPWAFNFENYPVEKFEVVYEDDVYRVFQNKDAFPRAFLVDNYIVGTSDSNILETIFQKDINLRETVIMEENPQIADGENLNSSVNITSYTPNKVEMEVNSSKEALLILTDNYYPGWLVKVNDAKEKIYRANYTFRAVKIPPGSSKVEFYYLPYSLIYGTYLSFIGLTILVILSISYNRKRK